MSDVSLKQAAFVAEYLKDRNATQAAIRAGYSAKTASSQGERLLRNVEVRAAVDAALAKVADRAEVTAERVIRERARLAFFDVRKLLDAEGNPIPMQDLDDDTAAAIAGLDVATSVSEDGSTKTTVRRYRLASKEQNLAALEKRLGLTEKPIRFTIPGITDLEGCIKTQEAIITAVAAGDILPSEGESLSRMVENKRRSIETSELETRIAALEHGRK
jgi:phage terminase small subunit